LSFFVAKWAGAAMADSYGPALLLRYAVLARDHLPEDSCVEDVRRGALVHVLPQWSTPEGIVHLVFTTTRGMLPAVSSIISPKPFPL
jgi:hypothetical protein